MEGQKQTDSAVEDEERIAKCAFDTGLASAHRCRIWNAPVRGQ
jgi:hypothetical protein